MVDEGDRDVIPKSMQLVAGRTGQEYNQRKCRKGGFWEDRYHATAVERGALLISASCLHGSKHGARQGYESSCRVGF